MRPMQAMDLLFLDIETAYSPDPLVHARLREGIKPPGNMSKAETIAKWTEEQKPLILEKMIAGTALNGGYGRVIAMGTRVGCNPDNTNVVCDSDETVVLRSLFDMPVEHGARPVFVGHNILQFDLRFILHRAIVNGIRIPSWFPKEEIKPWSDRAFDTMTRWAGARGRISQNELAFILGIPVKETIASEDVPQAFYRGERDKIIEHCEEDLEVNTQIHAKMSAAGLDA